jgi:5'(3')-deoxyribonucleotidase
MCDPLAFRLIDVGSASSPHGTKVKLSRRGVITTGTCHHALVAAQRLRLGIDLDGVVADFNGGWTRLHNDEFGGSLSPDLVTTWDGLHSLGGFDNMDSFWAWARGNDERPSIFRHLDLLPGALDTLQALDAEGHYVVIVSTKPDWAVHETMHWLADNRIPTREVHLTFTKHLVDCDVYLDDAPGVLPDLVEHHPDALVCRYVRPWNEPVAGAVDVHDWAEFHTIVTERNSLSVTDAAD